MRDSAAVRRAVEARMRGGDVKLFAPITKVDEARRMISGVVTEEALDKSGEVFDYDSSKPFYEKWSSEFDTATGGRSRGNLRSMHGNRVAGKIVSLNFDDAAKRISCIAEVVAEEDWNLCVAGAYTGFSHAGRVERRWVDRDSVRRYTVDPIEVSLVDNPCLPSARFELVKADGTTQRLQFRHALTTGDPDELDYLARVAALERGAPLAPRTSAANALLEKAAGLGGLDRIGDAAVFNPDIVAKLQAEPLPGDLLPTEKVALLSIRSGLSMSECLKRDGALAAAYALEMQGRDPVQRARQKAADDASRQSYAIRKAVVSDGPILLREVTIVYCGQPETDPARRKALVQLAQRGRVDGLQISAGGALLEGHDVAI